MAENISLSEASAAMRAALQETVKRNSLLFLAQAALLIIAGIVAVLYPLLTSKALALFLGWILIIGGVFQIITLIGSTKVPHFWLQLVSTVLAMIVGFIFLNNPGIAVGTLVLLMIVFFMVEGVSKIVFALSVRPLSNWGWVLVSGLVSVLISFYLLGNPALSLWLLGIFIGIQLISQGIAIGSMALKARRS